MLQGEHSAILSAFIKLPFVFKTFVLSIFKWPLETGFTVQQQNLTHYENKTYLSWAYPEGDTPGKSLMSIGSLRNTGTDPLDKKLNPLYGCEICGQLKKQNQKCQEPPPPTMPNFSGFLDPFFSTFVTDLLS